MLTILLALVISYIIYVVSPEGSLYFDIYLILAVIVVPFYLLVKRIDRCPKCKKSFAMKEVSRTLVDMEPSTERVEKSFYNYQKGCKEYYTDIVPAIKKRYDIWEECQYCGHRRFNVKTEKEVHG